MLRNKIGKALAALLVGLLLLSCSSDDPTDPPVEVPDVSADVAADASEDTTEPEDVQPDSLEDAQPDVPDVVGPSCAEYCSAVTQACTDENAVYADIAGCLAYCGTWAGLPSGLVDDTDGNTLGCRIHFAELAIAQPGIQCVRAGPTGGDSCGSWCDNYCHLALRNCQGDIGSPDGGLYQGEAECQDACSSWPDFADSGALDGNQGGNSVQCRLYHVGVAGSALPVSADTHCPHAAPDGGGVCVAPPDAPTCAAYCAQITATCTGDNAQYAGESDCLDYCQDFGALAPGGASDVSGDTIGCRMYHAGVAADGDDAEQHCLHAGPSGGDVCGGWCAVYCHLTQANCTGDNALYGTTAECTQACPDVADDGHPGDTLGDTIQCRTYHAGVAGNDQAGGGSVHCAHAALDGGGVCIAPPPPPDCPSLCASVDAACSGAWAQYESVDACVTLCQDAQIPAGQPGDIGGNSRACRAHFAALALADPSQCPAAGPTGGGACGDWCENFCGFEDVLCTDDPAYPNVNTCAVLCDDFAHSPDALATSGNTVQCRFSALVAGDCAAAAAMSNTCFGGLGETCAPLNDQILGCGDKVLAVSNGGAGSTTEMSSYHCQPFAEDDYSGGPEIAWAFSTDVEQVVTISESGSEAVDVVVLKDEGFGCLSSPSSCVASDPAGAMFLAEPGATYYAIFDAWNGQSGAFDVSVTCCTQQCDGPDGPKQCGDDGCGSTCGECAGGEQCNGAVCELPPPPVADTCEAAFEVGDLPFVGSGDTTFNNDDTAYGAGVCPGQNLGWGALAPDQAWRFEAPARGVYSATIIADFDSTLYAVGDCAAVDATCLAADESVGSEESVSVALEAGEVVFFIADGFGFGQKGQYSLTVDGVVAQDAPDCAYYCALVDTACTGDQAQYTDTAACQAHCATFGALPVGDWADTDVNSVGCRIYHAGVALAADASLHCGHAGPTGGGVCGSWCNNYCALAQANCTDDAALYADQAECEFVCSELSDAGTAGDVDGDSVQCRIYHLGVAGDPASGGPLTHCPHAAVDGGGVCVGAPKGETCDNPFDVVVDSLPWETSADTSSADSDVADGCAAAFVNGSASNDHVYAFTPDADGTFQITLQASFDSLLYVATDCGGSAESCLGDIDDIGSDKVEQLTLDLTSGQTVFIVVDGWAANNGSEKGTYSLAVEAVIGVGLTCEYYCQLVQNTCVGADAQYPGDDCLGQCQTLNPVPLGTLDDTAGDTLGCRIYHAEVAGQGDPGLHCPHAGPVGGNVCGTWCDVYCRLATDNCQDTNALYADDAACQTACTDFDDTAPMGSIEGDSVQCRLYHLGVAADLAAGGPAVHCSHGAADGGGVCVPPPEGDTCEQPYTVASVPYSYTGTTLGTTSDMEAGCAEFFTGAASGDEVHAFTADFDGAVVITLEAEHDALLYVNEACADSDSCVAWDDQFGTNQSESVVVSVAAGTTLFIWVDGFSSTADESGAYTLTIEPLAPEITCDYYCALMDASCVDEQAQYAVDGCLTACSELAWPAGDVIPAGEPIGASGLNTLACRIGQAQQAAANLDHCATAGLTGADTCGTWCDNYCFLAAAACQEGDSLYADEASCLSACGGIGTDGLPGDGGGDSIQCRIHQLTLGQCANGAADGGATCITLPGDDCSAPFVVDALPYSGSADTTDGSPVLSSGCVLSFGGAASNDHVYQVTVPADGEPTVDLEIQVQPTGWDPIVYLLGSTCGETCEQHSDEPGFATETLTTTVAAGQTIYFVVDGWGDATNEAGPYSVDIAVVVPPTPGAIDLSGWSVVQQGASQSFTLPEGTSADVGDYLILARESGQAAFEAYWQITLSEDVVFLNTGNKLPKINGGETFELRDALGLSVDGPTAPETSVGDAQSRIVPVGLATNEASWVIADETAGTPGSGQAASVDGIYISEFADATGTGNFGFEFLELYISSDPTP